MKRLIATLLIGAMAGVLPGCADILGTRNSVAAGTVTGGVLGAVTGNRNTALNGAVIGYYSDKQTASGADAAKKYSYAAAGDRPEIDSATLTPESAQSGPSVADSCGEVQC